MEARCTQGYNESCLWRFAVDKNVIINLKNGVKTVEKNRLFGCVFCLICIFCFAGCKEEEKFEGSWQIESLVKENVYQSICISDLSVIKEDGKVFVAGNSGVNRYNGIVTFKDKKSFEIKNLASTRMMGSLEEMEFENLFLQTLTGVVEFCVSDDYLVLENKEKQLTLTFFRKSE